MTDLLNAFLNLSPTEMIILVLLVIVVFQSILFRVHRTYIDRYSIGGVLAGLSGKSGNDTSAPPRSSTVFGRLLVLGALLVFLFSLSYLFGNESSPRQGGNRSPRTEIPANSDPELFPDEELGPSAPRPPDLSPQPPPPIEDNNLSEPLQNSNPPGNRVIVGNLESSETETEIEAKKRPRYGLQIGAYQVTRYAWDKYYEYADLGYPMEMTSDGPWLKVIISGFASTAAAEAYRSSHPELRNSFLVELSE